MSTLLKKFILSFLSFSILFFSVVPNFSIAKADDDTLWIHQWYGETNPFNWYSKVYDQSNPSEIFGERYTAAQVQWVIYGVFSFFWNFIPGNPELTICLMNGDLSSCASIVQKVVDSIKITDAGGRNIASSTGGVFSFIGQNPVSGIYYVKNLINKFTFVSSAHAQGFGYSSAANSIVGLWRITRDVSYGLIVLVVIVFAFMIMFRVKISPQVVISIQSAIPKVFIALILITFSYAIAGFVIDLMYVVVGIIAAAISTGGLSTKSASELFMDLTSNYSAVGLLYLYWIHFIVATLGSIFSNGWNFLLGIFAFLFAIVSILIILLWSVKIIWMLIKTFALTMITIAIGPLEILLGTVTGSAGFGSWLKRLVSYLAVYPITGLMFFLSFFFLYQGGTSSIGTSLPMPFSPAANVIGPNGWLPPLSVVTSSGYQLIWVLVSFFVFSQVTKVSELVQSMLSGKPFAYGTGIGEAFGPVRGVWNQFGVPIQRSMQEYSGSMAAAQIYGALAAISRKMGLSNQVTKFEALQAAASKRTSPS